MSEPQRLVARLLGTPDIARIVPCLPPELLHRLIDHCGLDACADVVALATPRQLRRVLDIDLWRAPVAGADERFDAARFGAWLELLQQMGGDAALDRLAAMDLDLVAGGLAAHVAVFDAAAIAGYVQIDGERVEGRELRGQSCEIGGYAIEARQASAWDAVTELLALLATERAALFHRVMRACVALSHGEREKDGCDELPEDRIQQMADLALDREERRDRQGYVPAAQSRAFLRASRHLHLDGAQPPIDPVARAALRDVVPVPPEDDPQSVDGSVAVSEAMTAVVDVLAEAGLVGGAPRALLTAGAPDQEPLALVRDLLESHATAPEQLAFLANALGSGCSLQGRPFTVATAADAVLATCNLGLENWPSAWHSRDLVTAFQIGWTLLHRDLCRHAAQRLVEVLAAVECADREAQWSLQTLRRELRRHLGDGEPWRARDALDALLMLDAAAWAILQALIDECPTLHAALASPRARTIDAAAVRFAAHNHDIARARDWLVSLPSTLTE